MPSPTAITVTATSLCWVIIVKLFHKMRHLPLLSLPANMSCPPAVTGTWKKPATPSSLCSHKGSENGTRLHPVSCSCRVPSRGFTTLPNWILVLLTQYLIVLWHKPIWSVSLTTWNSWIKGFRQEMLLCYSNKNFSKGKCLLVGSLLDKREALSSFLVPRFFRIFVSFKAA